MRLGHCRILARVMCHSVICPKAQFFSFPGSSGGANTAKRKVFSERQILGYSMEQMFDVVADVEGYKKFLPWCETSTVKLRRNNQIIAHLVIGMNPVVESYTSRVTLKRPDMIRAVANEGRLFTELLTIWRFFPGLKTHPQSCLVDFHVSFEFRSVLTSQLAHVFFNEVVQAMTGAFYEEAKRRYGPESFPARKVKVISAPGSKEDV